MKKRVTLLLAMLLSIWSMAQAQDIVVTGKVVALDDNAPMPGINVVIKGTTNGTSTNAEGKYSITVTKGATLQFSFIGYETEEVLIADDSQTSVDVKMNLSISTLQDVVVVGYGSQQKRDLSTAVVSVSTKDIEERPMVQAGQVLQGKAAGVQVTQPSGKPGSALSIRVRGATSMQAGNDPLYVVDGVPTTDIRDINTNDIESMQVLKDAASAAIYGARAANGVVIITTKRGTANKSSIDFGAYWGVSKITKTIDVLNSRQYADLQNEMNPGSVPSSLVDKYDTDWSKKVFRQGSIRNYQLSFRGGNEKTKYYVSGSTTQDIGIIKPAQYERYALRMNLDNQVKDWFKLTTNLAYSNVHSKNVKDNSNAGRNAVVLGALGAPPTMDVYEYDALGRRRFTSNPLKAGWDNPMAAIDGPSQGTVDNRLLGNVVADLKLYDGLSFKSNMGLDFFNHKYDYYVDYIQTTGGRTDHGYAEAEKSNSMTTLWENTLNYEKSFGKHTVSGLAGITRQENKWNQSWISAKDFPEDSTVHTINAANVINDASTTETRWLLQSYIARANYNYDGKYYLNVNLRSDGSSKLAKDHRWGYFPSASVAWRLSSEKFMESVTAVNDLKLRASWGQNGNQEGLGTYASYGLNGYTRITQTTPPSGPAINPPSYAPNPDLKWETTTQTNIGLDVSVLNSRVTLSVDAYIKKTKDLLSNVPLPSTTGLSYMPMNAGNIENKGLEFLISSHNIDNGAFTWKTDFNISFNRNKVTKLDLVPVYRDADIENKGTVIIVREGLPLGSFYGYIADGVDPETGAMKYKDLDGNGEINDADKTVIGNAQPKFTYGINNELKYKNFTLSFLWQGSYGNDIFNASRIETEGMFDSKNQSTEVLRRWTTPGQITDIPKAGDANNSRISTRFVENGSFFRLKNLTLNYSFDKALLAKARMTRLSVYGTVQNLITFTKYKGFDPEVNAWGTSGTALGIDYGTYPQAKSFILGVNVSF